MSDHTEKTYPAAEMRHEIVAGSHDVVLQKRFRKINRVNAIIAKFLTILKLQPNRATLRNDLTQAVR